jgi:hypothetical protein
MGNEIIKAGDFVMLEDEPSAGRFIRWYENGISYLTGDQILQVVVLMGDGRVRVAPADQMRVQMEGSNLELEDSCPEGFSIGKDFSVHEECANCDNHEICRKYSIELNK